MELNPEDKKRVEAEVRRMVAELRARPTQEKEDALGLEIARMPTAEREFVTTVLRADARLTAPLSDLQPLPSMGSHRRRVLIILLLACGSNPRGGVSDAHHE